MPLFKRASNGDADAIPIGINEFESDEQVVVGSGKIFITVDQTLAGKRLKSVVVSCFTPGADDTEGVILKNGSPIAGSGWTIGDGLNVSDEVSINESLALGDRISIRVDVIGDPACTGLSATLTAM